MASRKLQGEIDRVLKRVDEGVGVFEQIWDKVYSATTTAQKEKYEGDLKKEIKKLQRLRDQIKTWQGDSSIKDKSKLDSNRKLIEEKMEKFKICEKETKTKAFSKEGLAQDRTDPQQKAKAAVGNWVKDAISALQEQSDEMEAEIETLNSGKRKKRSEENPRVSDLKEHISKHEFHVGMLERVLRAVYNDGITPEETEDLKESVEYYIDSNQDPDFYEDDEMYDLLNLDSVPALSAANSKKSSKHGDRDDDTSSTSNGANSSRDKKGPSSPRNGKNGRGTSSASHAASKSSATASAAGSRAMSPKTTRGSDRSPPSSATHSPRSSSGVASALDATGKNPPLLSSVVKGATAVQSGANSKTTLPAADPVVVDSRHVSGQTQLPDVVVRQGPVIDGTEIAPNPETDGASAMAHAADDPQHLEGVRGSAVGPKARIIQRDGHANTRQAKLAAMDPTLAEVEGAMSFMPETPTEASKQSLSTAAPKQNPSTRNLGNGTAAPAAAAPQNPVATPPSFPSVPAPVFDSREVFERFKPDTLFFIFYYQQGTYQQYLAARELKRQGWRFHKKYLTWFQRHDEPKMSTDEYETGTFIYFDYANVVVQGKGSGWCQRIKSEFVFEYRFLEDELKETDDDVGTSFT
ncbi:unnamed protein product [Chondrus crispus]|uniref:CCR4-NOT transcription complex subunit 3 n=1 Tax=Chondrus crispus TaxID=2769 RepID=R7QQT9_CHOCR|nr:unnamed protein product [Chondrus crispus]CDF40113.1 unnamed protein product [Chondrus crispus]|eukprot:XP_005710407.1 unnamed protein product [Chondrus crispus]